MKAAQTSFLFTAAAILIAGFAWVVGATVASLIGFGEFGLALGLGLVFLALLLFEKVFSWALSSKNQVIDNDDR